MSTSTLTKTGETTVPQEVREHLGLAPGDTLEFVIEADGRVTLRPRKRSIRDLKGFLPKPERALSLEEIDDAIAEAAIERALRK
jgi:AbrB family looped-hinge helix DNA binding protein